MFKIKKRNHSFDCVFFINYCRVPIPLFGVFIDTQSKLTNEKVSEPSLCIASLYAIERVFIIFAKRNPH